MFSPALGRAVRSTCAISAGPVCTATRAATVASISAASQALSRRPHQRRPSSSKASIPPDGSSGSSSPQQATSTPTARSLEKKPAARGGRKRTTTSLLNVPHVPPTDHLQQLDVKISSFFSLHRPISVTTPIPTEATEASFGAIFEPRLTNNRSKYIDIFNSLSNTVERLETAAYGNEESDLRAEILHNSSSNSSDITHLDEIPQAKIDRMIAQLIPFNAPPPPAPFGQSQTTKISSKERNQDATVAQAPQTKQKAWSTTVVVTESTDALGERTYSASTSPMVEIQVPNADKPDQSNGVEIRQPFLDRMRNREQAWTQYHKRRDTWLLISTKRRRSLKMKKHKYKKLMKRTRLLRRKLDRA